MIVQPIVKIGPARDKDPTRTLTLRNRWIAEINSRYGKLKKAITEYVVEQNILGGHEKAAEPPHEIAVMYDPNQPRVPKGNPAGGQWTKVGGGGSVPGPRTSDEVSDRASLESFADASLPRDTETHEYFYHAARWDSDIDSIAEHGLDPKKTPGGAFYASKDEIRDRGSGFVIFKAPRGEGEEGTDVVEEGLSYREWVFTSRVPPQDVVKVVRVVTDKEGFRIREDDLAKHILSGKLTKDEFLSLPEKYQKWVVLSPLSTNSLAVLAAPKYVYEDSAAKIDGFMGWLDQQVQSGILVSARREGGVVGYGNRLWSDVFIESAYQRGIAQARADLNGVGVDLPDMGPVSTAFNRPFHADRVALLYTRAFNGMKGITEAMKSQMSDVLAQGMAEGRSPYDIAYKLRDRVDKIGITRARLIARTEVVRAHNVATLNEYEALEGVVGEKIYVQWWTALDERVRTTHKARHARRYTRETAQGLIGEPNCRCSLLPWLKTISDIRYGNQPTKKALAPAPPVPPAAKSLLISEKTQYARMQARLLEDELNMSYDSFDLRSGGATIAHCFNEYRRMLGEFDFSRITKITNEARKDLFIFRGPTVIKTASFRDQKTLGQCTISWKTEGSSSRSIKSIKGTIEILGQGRRLASDPTYVPLTGKIVFNTAGKGVSYNLETVFRHEFGHFFHTQWTNLGPKDVWDVSKETADVRKEWSKLYNKYKKDTVVSVYAKTDESEFFAESFAVWTSPKYGVRTAKLPEDVEAFFQKLLPRVTYTD